MTSPDPPRNRSPESEPPPDPGRARDAAGDLYSLFWREDLEERRGIRLSIAGAIVVHAVLLMVTFPDVYSREIDAPDQDKIFVVKTVRFRPPVTPPEVLPEPRARIVPIPDRDPDGPELVRHEEPRVDLEMPPPDMDLVFGLPDAPPEPDHVGPYVIDGRIEPPVKVHTVTPAYTELARRTGIQGTVVLSAVITRDGRVTRIEATKELPFGLTQEAVKAVEQWRYRPATLNGKPVDVFLNLSIVFNIRR